MIGKCSIDKQHRVSVSILKKLAVPILGIQITTIATIQFKDTSGTNKLEKTTKVSFAVILRAIVYKEDIEKERKKIGQNLHDLSQQTEDLLTKL